jgi:hypothetical protein
MRFVAIGAMVAFAVASSGMALAQSKCDSGLTKAAGKKVACKAGVVAKAQGKGTAPDSAKLAKCEAKFTKACTKALAKGDCSAQGGSPSCATIEAEVDSCVADIDSSPSGAFLD